MQQNLYKLFDTKNKRIIVILVLIMLILLISFLYYRFYSLYRIGIPCIFHEITGLYCPGCGITRALFSLFELNIKKALQYNILIFILSPFLLYYVIISIKNWLLFKKQTKIITNWILYIILIITVLFGILRNISCFDFLRPVI